MTNKFNFIKPTLKFTVVGFFIPGFTAIGLLGFQMLLSNFGVECATAWAIIWCMTILGAIISPILFIRYIRIITEKKRKSLKIRLNLFNIFQYIFIQASLTPLFTDGRTLCYVSDGQNGIELAFTAWLSLPILIALSFMFKSLPMTEEIIESKIHRSDSYLITLFIIHFSSLFATFVPFKDFSLRKWQ